MASSTAFKQDLPPKGGYAPIDFKRIPARVILGGKALIGGFIVYQTAMAYYLLKHRLPQTLARHREAQDFRLALTPLLLAERDRGYIKQLKANRDAEEDLMKDVEGWEVGTWYGEKVYKTCKDELLPHFYGNHMMDSPEYGVHFRPKEWDWDRMEQHYHYF